VSEQRDLQASLAEAKSVLRGRRGHVLEIGHVCSPTVLVVAPPRVQRAGASTLERLIVEREPWDPEVADLFCQFLLRCGNTMQAAYVEAKFAEANGRTLAEVTAEHEAGDRM
jgi:hypothetical protein